MDDSLIRLDALIVGAGFAGLNALWRLREMGLSALAVEAGDDVGGVWYWNRYPGARCDVESLSYAYSFSAEIDAEWRWSERYGGQREIQSYLRFVSERLDLRRAIRFGMRVTSARYKEDAGRWLVTTDDGSRYDTRFCIMATGPLTIPQMPDIPGIDDFRGEAYHTGAWPDGDAVGFEGKRVGVIGTGSSAVQLVPIAASSAASLTVFVRTPNYVVPAFNAPLTEGHYAQWIPSSDQIREDIRSSVRSGSGDTLLPLDALSSSGRSGHDFPPEEREEILEARWKRGGSMVTRAFRDTMRDDTVNGYVSDFLRRKIRGAVEDPAKAEVLTPRIPIGGKRICIGTDYYEAFNRPTVDPIDVEADPIARIIDNGVMLQSGRGIEFDLLVYATGFDALTGALTSIDIQGITGRSLAETWKDGAQCYLGLMVAGFPNMLVVGGPGSPSVFSNVVNTNEILVDFIVDLIAFADEKNAVSIDVDPDAQERWADEVDAVAKGTVFSRVASWYNGANVPGKPRRFLPWAAGISAFRERLRSIATQGFVGFRFI